MQERFAASDIAERAEQALSATISDSGFDLLLCAWTGTSGRPALQVYIERPNGDSVGINDCVAVHHAITDVLDVEDFIPVGYDLEVSSPGLERPLKRPEHFELQVDKEVRVRTWEPIDGRRNWKGRILSVDGEILAVEVDGQEYRIPIPAVERASLVYQGPTKGQKKGANSRTKRSKRS